jgi:hypothetical protein
MTKRLTALGFAIVGVVWGPYVYAELARKPLAPAEAPVSAVIEPTPVAYATPAQERAQLLAALAERRKAAPPSDPANGPRTEPVADEPIPAEPAAAEAVEPMPAVLPALPPAAASAETVAAASAETTAAAATDPARIAAAQPERLPQPAAAPSVPQPPAAEPAAAKPAAAEELVHNAAAKESLEAEAKHEERADEHHDEKRDEKADDKHDDKTDDKHDEKRELAASTPESLAPAFRSAFDRESRDAAWANGEEPRLTQLLAGAGVPASAIGEVRCQSTVCRVALNSVDAKAVQQSPLYQLLYQRVRDEFGTLGLDNAGGDGEQHAAFYVLRKGAELSRDTN